MKCMKNKGDGGTRYSCSPSPNRGRGYSSSPLRRDNRRRSPSDSPPRGGSGGGRGSPGGAGGGPGRFSPSRRHGSHSSNRSSRSPSNGAGNVGGRGTYLIAFRTMPTLFHIGRRIYMKYGKTRIITVKLPMVFDMPTLTVE